MPAALETRTVVNKQQYRSWCPDHKMASTWTVSAANAQRQVDGHNKRSH